ncbi:2986_t:CDS:2 [Cetraspora pellucida]|uniref:2986_t:CDS:1 n=1 Tax=Cetraspora pellucida TaxID=1433469 RepID=A0ACA9KJ87_9GLOM|nr:2986_t:CDS:2 [Cetraspora pellucida]
MKNVFTPIRYGYLTNTRVKFVVVLSVPDAVIKNSDMKNVCNPFYNLDGKKSIVSKRFVDAIDAIGKMTGDEVSSSSP